MFHTDNLLPSSVFIDHTMTVQYKYAGHDGEEAINSKIQSMLDNLYGAPILSAETNVVLDNELDNDGILNPSEGFSVSYSISNNSFEADAFNTIATLTISDGGIITSSDFVAIDDILLGETETFEFSIQLNDEIAFGDFDMNLLITAEYINNYGEVAVYEKNVEYSVGVSLNQFGFPFSTAEIKASPLVIDLDDDGEKEIIFGDNNGFVHVYNADGSEVDDDT
ncbi:MAG: hypothetical protein QF472_03645, partial [Candidatus Marinimicrobia bacterium]|nr:hypothetical protein [Candidatus Neomarinimicrobiota bacterium]